MEAFFLAAGDGGQRFCIHHAPAGAQANGAVLYIHPFAEEMNKSRRMAALQARALAAAGHAVLQIDLRGCGDSSDDFGDASWDDWLEDIERGIEWLQTTYADRPLWLWGLRGACLLASEISKRRPERFEGLLYWHPVIDGKLHLQQFLRLRLAAEMDGSRNSALMKELRAALAANEAVEVAGYSLNPALARGLEAARLQPPTAGQRLLWLELSSQGELLPASQLWLQSHAHSGMAIRGPAFWASTELEEAPDLITTTLQALRDSSRAVSSVTS